jgi:hypothetical protein
MDCGIFRFHQGHGELKERLRLLGEGINLSSLYFRHFESPIFVAIAIFVNAIS